MNQMFVVCFDVCDDKRLRRIAREIGNFGARVQKSVFECHLDDSELAALQQRLARLLNEKEDNVRYYPLCPKDASAILIDGPGRVTLDPDFVIIG